MWHIASGQHMDSLEWWRIRQVLPHVRGRLLDVACGFNNLVHAYRAMGGQGVGIDIFPWPGVDALIGNAAQLPFPAAVFDTVAVLAALNHIPNREEALLEMRRVLRHHGRFLVTMIGPRTGMLAHRIFVRDEQARGGMEPGERHGLTREEMRELLQGTGFGIVEEVPFQLGLNRVFVCSTWHHNQ